MSGPVRIAGRAVPADPAVAWWWRPARTLPEARARLRVMRHALAEAGRPDLADVVEADPQADGTWTVAWPTEHRGEVLVPNRFTEAIRLLFRAGQLAGFIDPGCTYEDWWLAASMAPTTYG